VLSALVHALINCLAIHRLASHRDGYNDLFGFAIFPFRNPHLENALSRPPILVSTPSSLTLNRWTKKSWRVCSPNSGKSWHSLSIRRFYLPKQDWVTLLQSILSKISFAPSIDS
jgi:hypothetical protein